MPVARSPSGSRSLSALNTIYAVVALQILLVALGILDAGDPWTRSSTRSPPFGLSFVLVLLLALRSRILPSGGSGVSDENLYSPRSCSVLFNFRLVTLVWRCPGLRSSRIPVPAF